MDLVKFFFQFQSDLKLYHWVTLSHPRHLASGTLHDSLIILVDKFMEIYFGRYSRINTSGFTINITQHSDDNMIEVLKEANRILQSLESQHPIIYSKISKKDTELLNIRDEMVGLINQTLYLFELR